ncbi:hypothetical protein LTY22_05685 [Limosilactobacillus agrestis]|nr:hypothetical protein [Limosilactobacillus agrestis]
MNYLSVDKETTPFQTLMPFNWIQLSANTGFSVNQSLDVTHHYNGYSNFVKFKLRKVSR